MILFRYLTREILTTTAAVSFALVFIFVSARFVKYLAQAASGSMSSDILFSVILYRMPGFLELIIPLGFFLAVLLSFGRLYVESEMIVMQACGVSKRKLLTYLQIPALGVMLLVGAISLVISPMGLERFHAIWDDPDNFSGVGVMMSGRFQSYQKGKGVSYADEVTDERTKMQDIFLAGNLQQSGNGISVVVADSGKVIFDTESQQRYVELNKGYRYEGTPGTPNFTVTQFEVYGQRLEATKSEPRPPASDAKSSLSLFSSSKADDQAALQWRISVALSIPILALIALSLSETSHRRGRFIKLLPGIIIYILYVVGLSLSRGAMEKGQIPPAIGMWPVHGVFFMIGLYLYYADIIKYKLKRKA